MDSLTLTGATVLQESLLRASWRAIIAHCSCGAPKSIALSTAEAEYYSVSEMAIEMIYLRNLPMVLVLLANMGLPQEDCTEVLNLVFEDNTACIEWSSHVLGGRKRASTLLMRRFRTVTYGCTRSRRNCRNTSWLNSSPSRSN
jgi:hypothetical protein